ncbi:hypothetical protein BAUCODRAFT_30483 [Baudoinia panamericana UAMH 10762]|uniref:Uncharacterized protein n=1 Tax=Baudoinia panamericana (strain UAMH 10762) TaxID=717646 RepID=M2MT45_BAUPA|nr:uncharacterized protein BAUCODRAFT_30483 [Baudoinia panamericana UAMH 10762]EMD00037.1 hypothetical protein BAUCODRAFT_30483 [Baudoinia panamericana UAMH 10762]
MPWDASRRIKSFRSCHVYFFGSFARRFSRYRHPDVRLLTPSMQNKYDPILLERELPAIDFEAQNPQKASSNAENRTRSDHAT